MNQNQVINITNSCPENEMNTEVVQDQQNINRNGERRTQTIIGKEEVDDEKEAERYLEYAGKERNREDIK